MKKHSYKFIVLAAVILIAVALIYRREKQVVVEPVPTEVSARSTKPASPRTPVAQPSKQSALGSSLHLPVSAPLKDRIGKAASARDYKELMALLSECMDQWTTRDAALGALKPLLVNDDSYVRFLGADMLYRLGDRSGFDTLVSLAASPTNVSATMNDPRLTSIGVDPSVDVRIEAARTLGKYRETGAAHAVAQLYNQTGNRQLIQSLALLNAQEAIPEIIEVVRGRTYSDDIENLGQMRAVEAAGLIKDKFSDPASNEQTKIASAWAMTRLGQTEPYMTYLKTAAAKTLDSKLAPGNVDAEQPLKYFASIQSPDVKAFLEQALTSSNQGVVDIAMANLVSTQGGSEQADKILIEQFESGSQRISTDLAYRLAFDSKNPRVREAAQRRNPQLWSIQEHQKDWSQENWINNYVIH